MFSSSNLDNFIETFCLSFFKSKNNHEPLEKVNLFQKSKNFFKGVYDAFEPHAVLEVIPVAVGEVQIRGVETGLFLALKSSSVRAIDDSSDVDTVFIEKVSGPYLTYLRFLKYFFYIFWVKYYEVHLQRTDWIF